MAGGSNSQPFSAVSTSISSVIKNGSFSVCCLMLTPQRCPGSERNAVIPHFSCSHGRRRSLNLGLQRLDEPDRSCNVIKDQQTFLIIEDRVVVSQALVVPHIIESFKYRNTRLQNTLSH